ncbi:MAG TPA: hypothetical protein VIS96_16585 [Terrimicrobiaceae bacterium]
MRTELEAPGQSVGFEITNDNGEHYTAVDCPSRIAEIVKRRIGQGERVRQRGTRR